MSLRLMGNRDLAAQYWGEARRLLFQLQRTLELGRVPTGSRAMTYPDGTRIFVRSSFGNPIVEIESPFVKGGEEKQEEFYRDVIVFYQEDGVAKIAIDDVSLLGVNTGQGTGLKKFDASKFDITFGFGTKKILAKEFTYQGQKIFFVRMPLVFSGSTSVGHYLFEGCNLNSMRDYIWVPKTAKFHYLQDSDINTAFNVGDYIYAMNYMTMRAWSFNFDTETVTLEKEFNPYILNIRFIDQDGNFYYPDSSTSLTLYDSLQIPTQGILNQAPYNIRRDLSLGLANSIYELFDYMVGTQSSLATFASMGHWPGGVITPFVKEVAGVHLLHEQQGVVIVLRNISKFNIWTEASSLYLERSWSHTTYDLEGQTCLLSLNYEDHIDCFGKLDGADLIFGVHTNKSELSCGTPNYTHTSGEGFNNEHGDWVSQDKKTTLGKEHNSYLNFEGDSSDSWSGGEHTGHSLAIEASGTQVDHTIGLLPMPFGSSPFHTRAVRTMVASLTQSEDAPGEGGLDQTYSLDDTTVNKLVTPYEEVLLDNAETVAGWLHLQAKKVLAQAVEASVLGKIVYGGGRRLEERVADRIGVPLSQIYGIIYLPNITITDPEFMQKASSP